MTADGERRRRKCDRRSNREAPRNPRGRVPSAPRIPLLHLLSLFPYPRRAGVRENLPPGISHAADGKKKQERGGEPNGTCNSPGPLPSSPRDLGATRYLPTMLGHVRACDRVTSEARTYLRICLRGWSAREERNADRRRRVGRHIRHRSERALSRRRDDVDDRIEIQPHNRDHVDEGGAERRGRGGVGRCRERRGEARRGEESTRYLFLLTAITRFSPPPVSRRNFVHTRRTPGGRGGKEEKGLRKRRRCARVRGVA